MFNFGVVNKTIAIIMAVFMLPWTSLSEFKLEKDNNVIADVNASNTDAIYDNPDFLIDTSDEYEEVESINSILEKYRNSPNSINDSINDTNKSFNSKFDNVNDIPFNEENITVSSGYKLEEDIIIDGHYVLESGTLDLNGHKLIIKGDFIQSSGTVDINNGSLEILGSYRMQQYSINDSGEVIYTYSDSTLVMDDSEDNVKIGKDFIIDTIQNNKDEKLLSEGSIDVKGDLCIYTDASLYGFMPTSNHTIIMSSDKKQNIVIFNSSKNKSDSSSNSCHINNLINLNTSEEGTVFNYQTCITGSIVTGENKLSGPIDITESTTFDNDFYDGNICAGLNDIFNRNFTINGNLILNKPYGGTYYSNIKGNLTVNGDLYNYLSLTIEGELTVNGDLYNNMGMSTPYLNINGKGATINGNLINSTSIRLWSPTRIKGNLISKNGVNKVYVSNSSITIEGDCTDIQFFPEAKNSSIIIYGNYTLENNPAGYCAYGSLEVKGDLNVLSMNSSDSFKLILSGDSKQSISNSDKIQVGTIEINNHSQEGVVFDSVLNCKNLIRNDCNISFGNGNLEGKFGWTLNKDEVIDGNLVILDGNLDLNNHKLTVNGDFIQMSGDTLINGGALEISGSYRMQRYDNNVDFDEGNFKYCNASLVMKSNADSVKIGKDFIIWLQNDSKCNLENGTISLGGNLEIGDESSEKVFDCSNRFQLCLNGKSNQEINAGKIEELKIPILKFDSAGTVSSSCDLLISYQLISDIEDTYDGLIKLADNSTCNGTGINGNLSVGKCIFNRDFKINGNFLCTGETTIGANTTLEVLNNVESCGILNVKGNLIISGDYYGKKQAGFSGCGKISINNNGKVDIYGKADFNGNSGIEFTVINSGLKPTAIVHGNFSTHCYSNSTAGILYVGGDFVADSNTYRASGTNKIVLNGDSQQILDLGGGCSLATIEIANKSEEGVLAKKVFTKSKLIINEGCKFKYEGLEGIIGYKLEADTTINEDLVILDGEMDLDGHTLIVDGSLILMSGTLNVNTGTLIVKGDLRLQSRNGENDNYIYNTAESQILMNNPNDKIEIWGDLYNAISRINSKSITEGTILLHGDYYVESGASDYGFNPEGNSIVCLSNDNDHKLIRKDNKAINITNLWVQDASTSNSAKKSNITGSTILIKSSIYTSDAIVKNNIKMETMAIIIGDSVSGNFTDSILNINGIYDKNRNLIKDESLEINGNVSGTISTNNCITINGNLYGSVTINKDLYVNGNIDVNRLNIQSGKISCSGSISISDISMSGNDSYIYCEKNFKYNGTKQNKISQGTIEVKGNVDLREGFIAENNCKLILSGNKKQTIETYNRADIAILELKNKSKEGVYSKSLLRYDEIIRNGCKLSYSYGTVIEDGILEEDTVLNGDYYFTDGILDLNGHTLTVNGNLNFFNGSIIFNGGTLHVTGDFSEKFGIPDPLNPNQIYSNYGLGVLFMHDEKDTLDVDGTLNLRNVARSIEFKNGTVYVGGDFIADSGLDYRNQLRFVFDGKHNQKISGAYGVGINFSCLEINTAGEFSVNSSTGIGVSDRLSSTCTNNKVSISIRSLDIVEDGYIGNLKITQNNELGNDVHIDGNLSVDNILDLNGHMIYANDLTIYSNGVLIMDDKDDFIGLSGSLSIYGSREQKLTAGTIEINGNLDFSGCKTIQNEGSHEVIINKYDNKKVKITGSKSAKLNKLILRGHEQDFEFTTDSNSIANEVIYEYDDVILKAVENLKAVEVNLTSVKLSYIDNNIDVVAGYKIFRNNELLAVTSDTVYVDSSVKPNTDYIYKVYTFGKYGDISDDYAELHVKTVEDVTPPTVPDGLTIKSRSGKAITISWNNSTDDVAINGYKIRRNGKEIANIIPENDAEILFRDENVESETAYSYEIQAYDEANNPSDWSNSITAFTYDPTIIQITPSDEAQLIKGKNQFKIKIGNSGINSNDKLYIKYLNTNLNQWIDIPSAPLTHKSTTSKEEILSCYFDTTYLDQRVIDVKFILYDMDGEFVEENITYKYDNNPPKEIQGLRADSIGGIIRLVWSRAKDADVDHYDIYRYVIDESNPSETYSKIGSTSSINDTSYDDINVIEGQKIKYIVAAVDTSGNSSKLINPYEISVGKDVSSPIVNLLEPTDSRLSGVVHLTATANDNKAAENITFSYRWSEENENQDEMSADKWIAIGNVSVDNATPVINLSTEWDTSKLKDGIYQVKAVAYDSTGNESTEPSIKRYVIDNTGIDKINVTDYKAGSTFVQIMWDDVTENDFSYFSVVKLENDGNYIEIQKITDYTGCTIDGLNPLTEYTFKVAGVDNLGNIGEYSEPITIKTIADTILPVINCISPSPSKFSKSIDLRISAQDNDSLKEAVWSLSYDGKNYSELSRQSGSGSVYEYSYLLNLSDPTLYPEGKIYIKSECFDVSGNKNALMDGGLEIIAEYIIDRTAPAIPKNLSAKANPGNIELSWDMGNEDDISVYRIYRAEQKDGVFGSYRKIDEATSINYFDTKIESGKSYSYQIDCVDIAGNVSKRTAPEYVTAIPDTEIPEVRGVSPKDGTTIGSATEITYLVTDNTSLESLSVDIRPSSYSINEDSWTEVYRTKVSNMYVQSTFKIDFTDYDEGLYELRFITKDKSGNSSEYYYRTYYVDKTPCKGKLLETSADFKNVVSVQIDNISDYSYFEIYRCEQVDAPTEFEFYKKAKKIGDSYRTTYDDTKVVPGRHYCYAAKIIDKNGNFSWTNIVILTAGFIDNEKPVINSADKITAIAGYSFMLSAGASRDNVKIKSFTWDMGDGTILRGADAEYTYEKPGVYSVKLTVTDTTGNYSEKIIPVNVKADDNCGFCKVVVTDSSGCPIPYANVFINASGDDECFFMTDGRGEIYLAYKAGEYKIAAYKDGYLPSEAEAEIISAETSLCNISLASGEVVVGSFEIHRMTLQEIVDSGVDLSDPANLNTFTFTTTLTFEKRPIPIVVDERPGEIKAEYYGDSVGSGGFSNPHFGEGNNGPSDIVYPSYLDVVINEIPSPAPVPVIAVLQTTQTVSWLKTMYSANLTILNAADNKYVIEGATGTIELPDGVSLAKLVDGAANNTGSTIAADSEIVDMGSIAGQEQKRVSWILKGDKSGSYKIKARFDGILMPFNIHVEKSFIAEQKMEVAQANVEIVVMPENALYVDEKYYIQYAITNNGPDDLYNFKTSIGDYKHSRNKTQVYIMDYDTEMITGTEVSFSGKSYIMPLQEQLYQTPVLFGDDEITIPTLKAGQTIYGTWCKDGASVDEFSADPIREYFALIKSMVEVIEGENLGVKVFVRPIGSHITKYISTVWKGEDDVIEIGDPVDLSSGAFKDNYTALAIVGRGVLSLDMQYDSLFAGMIGEIDTSKSGMDTASATDADAVLDIKTTKNTCGYGWYTDFDSWIEEKNGMVHYYLNPYVYIPFISEKSKSGYLTGVIGEEGLTLSDVKTEEDVHFVGLYANTKDYDLVRHSDGSYTLLLPSGQKFIYDTKGRLAGYISEEGDLSSIKYDEADDGGYTETITEEVSGNSLILKKDKTGRLESANDNTGRTCSFSYDEKGNLISITNPLGEVLSYHYESDESPYLMTQSEDNEGNLIVENTYDSEGRVIKQIDSAGAEYDFSYILQDDGSFISKANTIHDGVTDVTTVKSNSRGFIEYAEDNTGRVNYNYDDKNNIIRKESTDGTWSNFSYNEDGLIVGMENSLGDNIHLSYDKAGNITLVSSIADSEKPEIVDTASFSYDEKGRLISSSSYGNSVNYTYGEDGILASIESEGRGTSYFTSEKGRIKSYTNEIGAKTVITYDNHGNINSVTNPLGGVTKYTYDAMDRVISEESPNGGTTTYTYNSLGLVTSETNPLGYTTYYCYDIAGRRISTKYPDGTEFKYIYDMLGRLIEKCFPDGTSEKYSYNEKGAIDKVTYADGTTESFEYSDKGLPSEVTDAIGNVTTYDYDSKDNLTEIGLASGAEIDLSYTGKDINKSSLGGVNKSFEYNDHGLVTAETDSLGNSLKHEYDRFGNLTADVDPNGNRTEYNYDVLGRCIGITYPNGFKVDQEFDLSGNVTGIHTSIGGKDIKYSYKYDKSGMPISFTDESGRTTSYFYDKAGQLIKEQDEFGNTIEYSYDCRGRVEKKKDNLGNVSEYQYDSLGNLIHSKITTANSNTTNKESREYSYTYDTLGRLLTVTDPMGEVTKQSYDAIGRITEVTDAMGGVTEYTYDNCGNIVEEKNAIGATIKYEYDSNNNLTKVTDGRGNVTKLSYDRCNRLIERSDEEGVINYTYDPNGNLLTVRDKTGTITRNYDEMNRVTSITDCNGKTLQYGYDDLGNIISLTYPGGEIVRYKYNPDGSLAEMSDDSGRKTLYGYDRQGRLVSTTRPDGSIESLSYDDSSNITIREDKSAVGELFQKYEYKYDGFGNIISVKESVKPIYKVDYILGATGPKSIKSQTDIKSSDDEKLITVTNTMEYDAVNRLIRYNGQEVRYDADGNMIYGPLNGKMINFTYDCRNRLVEADGVKYTYDAENVRLSSETTQYKEEYLTDRVSLLSRTLEIRRTETINVLQIKNTDTTCYYGIGLAYDVTSADNNTEDVRIYHFDHLGSTRYLTDESGNLTLYFDYGCYGEFLGVHNADGTENELSSLNNPVRYLYNGEYGVVTDDNSLLYMRQRYFDSSIKRFINQDLIKGGIVDSQSLNKYCYVEGNPINYLDPFGLSKLQPVLGTIRQTMHVISNIVIDLNNQLVNSFKQHFGDPHEVFDMLGKVPGVGTLFNLLNAGLYIKEHNYSDAFLSLLQVEPILDFIGGAIGKLFKFKGDYLGTMSKLAGEIISNGFKIGNSVADLIDGFNDIYDLNNEYKDKPKDEKYYLQLSFSLYDCAYAAYDINNGINEISENYDKLYLQWFKNDTIIDGDKTIVMDYRDWYFNDLGIVDNYNYGYITSGSYPSFVVDPNGNASKYYNLYYDGQ